MEYEGGIIPTLVTAFDSLTCIHSEVGGGVAVTIITLGVGVGRGVDVGRGV